MATVGVKGLTNLGSSQSLPSNWVSHSGRWS